MQSGGSGPRPRRPTKLVLEQLPSLASVPASALPSASVPGSLRVTSVTNVCVLHVRRPIGHRSVVDHAPRDGRCRHFRTPRANGRRRAPPRTSFLGRFITSQAELSGGHGLFGGDAAEALSPIGERRGAQVIAGRLEQHGDAEVLLGHLLRQRRPHVGARPAMARGPLRGADHHALRGIEPGRRCRRSAPKR